MLHFTIYYFLINYLFQVYKFSHIQYSYSQFLAYHVCLAFSPFCVLFIIVQMSLQKSQITLGFTVSSEIHITQIIEPFYFTVKYYYDDFLRLNVILRTGNSNGTIEN